MVQEIVRASKLHGINFERNIVPLSEVVVANRSVCHYLSPDIS